MARRSPNVDLVREYNRDIVICAMPIILFAFCVGFDIQCSLANLCTESTEYQILHKKQTK